LASYDAAIGLDPANISAHCNRALALDALGRLEEALESYDRALAVKPDQARIHSCRGIILQRLQRAEDALASYETAIAFDPVQAPYHVNRGLVLHLLRRFDDALASYDTAIGLDPANVSGHYNRALALEALGRLEEALESHDRALALEPDRAEIYNCRGIVLQRLQRAEDALASYERAIALDPDQALHHVNRGLMLHQLRRFDGAVEAYEKALALHADMADAHFERSLTQLTLGRLREGFEEYRWRWLRAEGLELMPELPFPPWAGEDLAGKSILVHGEQGFGDRLQFIRYAPLLAKVAARVTVVAHPALVSLFRSMPRIEFLADFDRTAHDYHVPLMCLPRLLGTTLETVPAETPYLHPDPAKAERWAGRLSAFTAPLKVGLVWAGNPRKDYPDANTVDVRRSMSLALFAPLLAIAGVEFFSLQKGEPAAQADNPAGAVRLIDWTAEFEDFSDTAALVANLDLVIAVDTSVAHLAGALGKPVWILSRHDGCWRWLNGREDSPWYPTARLFHQRAPGAWEEVVERVSAELARLVGARGRVGSQLSRMRCPPPA
jgi:Tfp pilus assembly protein PilF